MTESLDYFDAVEYVGRVRLREDIASMNEEFRQWMVQEGFYQEAVPMPGQAAQQKPKIPWQQEIIGSIKAMVGQTMAYTFKQMPGDMKFLNDFQELILNIKQYPPKPNETVQNATNYQAAIQRISSPISTGLRGLDLSKIEDDEKANIALKKQLVPTYDGKMDFAKFAKLYYYGGEGSRMNLNPRQVGQLLQTAFSYCQSYQTRIQSIQVDVNGIVSFIQTDPNSGQIRQQTQSDLNKIQQQQAAQQRTANQGMASTSPAANAGVGGIARPVNADTDYSLFMQHYFGSDWESLNEADPPVSGNKKVSPITNPKETKPTMTGPTTDQMQQNQRPHGAPVDANQLAKHKQEIAARIVRDALAAKLAAMSMIYRDFIFLMRTHVASYKGAQAANHGQAPQQPAPQQTQATPNQTPQRIATGQSQ